MSYYGIPWSSSVNANVRVDSSALDNFEQT